MIKILTLYLVIDHARIWKDKNGFAKLYIPNWLKEAFLKVKQSVRRTYVNADLNGK